MWPDFEDTDQDEVLTSTSVTKDPDESMGLEVDVDVRGNNTDDQVSEKGKSLNPASGSIIGKLDFLEQAATIKQKATQPQIGSQDLQQISPLPLFATLADDSNVAKPLKIEESTTESVLDFVEDQGSQSSFQIIENSVNLLKKLILLSASSLGKSEIPDFLKDVVKVNPKPVAEDFNGVQKRPSGTKNFKHRKFASFYKKLRVEEPLKQQDYEIDLKSDLKQSLRHQITKNALENHKLKAKANKVPIYHPRKRLNLTAMRSFYREAKHLKLVEPIREEHKSKLSNELQETLKFQLSRLEGDLTGKKWKDALSQENHASELSKSLKFQLSSVIRDLHQPQYEDQADEFKSLSDEELVDALEVKLKAFRNP